MKQYFLPRCLLDLLYITLWKIAAEDDTVLRRCRSCKGLFSVARTNRKRVYCTRICKNRMNVRKHSRAEAQKIRATYGKATPSAALIARIPSLMFPIV